MSGLFIAPPLAITDAMLTATDVTEVDYPVWAAGTTYAQGDRCMVTTAGVHKVYESLQAANSGKDPTLSANSAWWIEVGPTNRWRLFDESNTTATGKANSLYYVITPRAAINALYAGGMKGATQLHLTMTDPVYGVVRDQTIDLAGVPVAADPWTFCFGAWTNCVSSCVITDLPAFPNATVRVELTGGADLAIGVLQLSQGVEFGDGLQWGARAGIQDYSRKEKNDFGDLVLVERAYAKRSSFTLELANDQIDVLQDFLASVRATACLYVGYSPIAALTIFGFFKSFEILIAYPTHSTCEFEIEGLS